MILAKVSRIIEAPIGEVWAVTSSFGAIRAWMPTIEKISVEGAGIGAVRSVVQSGNVAHETLTELDGERHRIRYAIAAPLVSHIKGLVGGTDLTALDDGSTRIEWIAEADSVKGDAGPIGGYFAAFMAESLAGLGAFLKVPMREA